MPNTIENTSSIKPTNICCTICVHYYRSSDVRELYKKYLLCQIVLKISLVRAKYYQKCTGTVKNKIGIKILKV